MLSVERDSLNKIEPAFPQAGFSFSRSEIQTLMMDWRVTPNLLASLSNEWTIQLGKSTLTRSCSWSGLLALDKSS